MPWWAWFIEGWVVGVWLGWLTCWLRHRSRVRTMWTELGLRTQDHGPLEMREVADVVDHWT